MAQVEGPGRAIVGVCRPCEVVWVDAAAQARLPGRAELRADPTLAATHGIGSPEPTRCPNCGAPFSETIDGCCPYCRERVARVLPTLSAPELAANDTAEHAHERADADPHEDLSGPSGDVQVALLGRLSNPG